MHYQMVWYCSNRIKPLRNKHVRFRCKNFLTILGRFEKNGIIKAYQLLHYSEFYPTMNNTKNSFILYKSYFDILKDLPDEDAGVLFKAILKYQSEGEISQLSPSLALAFKFIKNQFDLDDLKYNEFIEKQSANGKKGGRPKIKSIEEEIETSEANVLDEQANEVIAKNENPKNPTLFLKTQKSLNDNENENENENENVSLISRIDNKGERENLKIEDITEADKQLIERYVKKNKLATKNARAYVNKIIANGDHIRILEEEREREKKKKTAKVSPDERIKAEIASIHDKRSALKVLARYHNAQEEFPPPLKEIAKKYNLDTSYELEKYAYELYYQKQHSPPDSG